MVGCPVLLVLAKLLIPLPYTTGLIGASIGGAVGFNDALAVRRNDSVAAADPPVRFRICANVGRNVDASGGGGAVGGGGKDRSAGFERCCAS